MVKNNAHIHTVITNQCIIFNEIICFFNDRKKQQLFINMQDYMHAPWQWPCYKVKAMPLPVFYHDHK